MESFDTEKRLPVLYNCAHSICKICFDKFPSKCPICNQENKEKICKINYGLKEIVESFNLINLNKEENPNFGKIMLIYLK